LLLYSLSTIKLEKKEEDKSTSHDIYIIFILVSQLSQKTPKAFFFLLSFISSNNKENVLRLKIIFFTNLITTGKFSFNLLGLVLSQSTSDRKYFYICIICGFSSFEWYMIDPSTHYKTARDIPPLSLTGNVKKVFFSQESSFRLYFAGASLLGTIILLAVAIRKLIPNNDA
jgi:hypothetical protein